MQTNTISTNYEIIVFSDDWDGLPFSCKHILRHFLPDIPLTWVETIGLRSPKFNYYDIRRAIQKVSGWISKTEKKQVIRPKNLHVIDPPQIPYNQLGFIRRINTNLITNTVNALYKKQNSNRERILLTTWPFLGDLIGSLNERLSIYYRVDDFSEFPGVRKNLIQQLEHELIEKVDMVVASAENLARVGKKAKYLPHGVDFQHFSKTESEADKHDLRIRNIPGPIIGFFGLLNSWIDFELLAQAATDNPDLSFVFIGPSQLPASALPSATNMHFLGPVSYEELPSYARFFDVALIPFKINPLTISVNPLKLMEYFSLGLPVVSTPLPEVKKHQNLVHIASDPKTFSDAVRKVLNEDDESARLSRKTIAEQHGWEKKSLALRRWIEEELELKIGGSI